MNAAGNEPISSHFKGSLGSSHPVVCHVIPTNILTYSCHFQNKFTGHIRNLQAIKTFFGLGQLMGHTCTIIVKTISDLLHSGTTNVKPHYPPPTSPKWSPRPNFHQWSQSLVPRECGGVLFMPNPLTFL